MPDAQDQLEKQLRNSFADYDQTVDVVSCWQAFTEYMLKDHVFFRFGKFTDAKGATILTPDFAIAKAAANDFASPGAMVFDVKKVPNPFPEGATENEAKAAHERFGEAVKGGVQVRKGAQVY